MEANNKNTIMYPWGEIKYGKKVNGGYKNKNSHTL